LKAEVINHVYLSALSRYPTDAEREKLNPLLSDAKPVTPDADQATKDARRQAIEDLFGATLTSRKFLFNHYRTYAI
jgi:hypothetical protein